MDYGKKKKKSLLSTSYVPGPRLSVLTWLISCNLLKLCTIGSITITILKTTKKKKKDSYWLDHSLLASPFYFLLDNGGWEATLKVSVRWGGNKGGLRNLLCYKKPRSVLWEQKELFLAREDQEKQNNCLKGTAVEEGLILILLRELDLKTRHRMNLSSLLARCEILDKSLNLSKHQCPYKVILSSKEGPEASPWGHCEEQMKEEVVVFPSLHYTSWTCSKCLTYPTSSLKFRTQWSLEVKSVCVHIVKTGSVWALWGKECQQ